MNKLKTTKGITLIALVITIIVLLILAGVSIAMLTGDNGILTQANKAKTETDYKGAEEKVKLAIMGARADDGQMTIEELTREVGLQGGSTTSTAFPAEVQMDGYTFTVDNTGTVTGNESGENTPTPDLEPEEPSDKPAVPTTESYVGYYADIDGDKNVDGIIYADLAVGGSGIWNGNSWSNYSYEAETGLKEYYIENENYTEPKFGNVTGKLIAPIEGTSGKDRFYVMALEDINPGTRYCWYDAAYEELDKVVSTDYNDFGDGKENTEYVMNKFDLGETEGGWGPQNDNVTYDDMWGVEKLRNKVNEGWFVPSKAEWSAFGDVATKTLGLTTSNYSAYGLRDRYWTSSQHPTIRAYLTYFNDGVIGMSDVNLIHYVRLSVTF